MTENYDKRKSDKIALTILKLLKEGDVLEKFKEYRDLYGKIDIIENRDEYPDNVLFPISLREGLFIRRAIREMGGKEWDWKKYVNMAILYDEGEVFGSGSE